MAKWRLEDGIMDLEGMINWQQIKAVKSISMDTNMLKRKLKYNFLREDNIYISLEYVI